MSDQNKELSAQILIEKLGGIRPLAKRLGLTPSTVQGWKQRDTIPDSRLKDVLDLVEEDGIDVYETFTETEAQDTPSDTPIIIEDRRSAHVNEKAEKYIAQGMDIQIPDDRRAGERRASRDRRAGEERRKANDPNYTGPERRSGAQRRSSVDRRHFQERRNRQIVWKTKWNFLERTVMSLSVIYMLATAAFIFLMGPEYHRAMQNADQVAALEKKLQAMGLELADIQGQRQSVGSFSGRLNNRIEQLDRKTDNLSHKMKTIGKLGDMAFGNRIRKLERKYDSLSSLMKTVDKIKSDGEEEKIEKSMTELQSALYGLRGDVGRIDQAVDDARSGNETVATILKDVSKQDLGAAAMLLALGQFRESVGSENAFSDDLSLIRDLVGDSPELQGALSQLAPYAESGILTPDNLQSEFGDLATEIIAAGLMGEDLSLGERAATHFGSMVTVTKDGKRILQPKHPIAQIVNTAHAQVTSGDLRGAVQTLQKLEGPAGKSAEKWVKKARGVILAGETNTMLSKNILNRVSSGRQVSVDSLESFLKRNFVDPLGVPQNRALNKKWDPFKNKSDQTIIKYD